MKPHLIRIVDGPDRGRHFEVEEGEQVVIGRGNASHTRVNDPRMSRVHGQLRLEQGSAFLSHTSTSNETTIRGQAIGVDRKLQAGECFRMGDTLFRWEPAEPIDWANEAAHWNLTPDKPISSVDQADAFAPADRQLLGKSLAHYRLTELIVRGRTGVLYRAEDTREHRSVAVKVLLPQISNTEQQRDRFVRAMQTMISLRHPNIVSIYHAGKQAGRCWMAMPLIGGESMQDVIARDGIQHMLDWRQVWEVAVDIARALAYADQHNIVHRNLAPANIIRQFDDGRSLLGDLMLAKATAGNLSREITAPGQLVGDLAYMSPERTRDGVDVDGRSDIYELGATLYALLTGRPPCVADSVPEQIRVIRDVPPVPPKEYQLPVNDMFQNIVLTTLAKSPDERYGSANQLLKELERVGRFEGLHREA